MREPKTCIINCAFRERYLPFQKRLLDSLVKYAPKVATKVWTDELPPGSPKHEDPTHYAFKLFAFQYAKQNGFERILWLDAGTEVMASIDPILEEISKRKVLLVTDEDALSLHIGDHCLEYFKMTRKQAGLYKLTGGGIIGIDLTDDKGLYFYNEWWWAFLAGLYKNGGNDHRWDESIFGCLVPKLHLDLVQVGPLWNWKEGGNPILRTGYERPAEEAR